MQMNKNLPDKKNSGYRLNFVLGFVLFVFIILAARYQYFLLNYIEWGDESETIVTAKMMASGQSLYSEIFNHHGPLTFFPGVMLELFGDFGVRGHRVPTAILQIISLFAIYCSPIFKNNITRLASVFYAAVLTIFFMPKFLGHMYTYQALTGLLLLIILFVYTFPSIIDRNLLTAPRVFTGSLLIVSLPFLASTYAPIAAILFLISLPRSYVKASAAGAFLGTAVNLLFLICYGSLKGFLVIHFYLNYGILPEYLDVIPAALASMSGNTDAIGAFLVFSIIGLLALASHEKKIPWRSMLLAIGIASLLIRGIDFHGLPYYYAFIGISLLPILKINEFTHSAKLVALFLILFCSAKASLLLPGDREKFVARRVPAETEFSRLVKKYTDKDDKIIAYSFDNFQYIAADRLPASGHFFYLPWQEKYSENPKFGINIDACKEIAEYRPKIMLINKWKVWGLYSWDSYGGCIQKIVDTHYTQVPDRPFYIRKDISAAETRTP
ncbi:hypothetical protein D8B22_01220 [Verminephrobacter aporrectodeae subsp. tuberculatae]|nr:hypothetical protein [Verminephrobacter aporrectodeae subsp. tuberculatae]MCW8167792.1 hypothetical protein [Verminephrobacter aporrectodeae subsp. tuberculatae]